MAGSSILVELLMININFKFNNLYSSSPCYLVLPDGTAVVSSLGAAVLFSSPI